MLPAPALPSPPTPPPLWFVTNGDVVVGPVNTNLLLRGVTHERIPEHCLVRGSGWSRWRALPQIREVSELRRREALRGRSCVPKATWEQVVARRSRLGRRFERLVACAGDPGEVLLFALSELMTATGATVGLAHRRRFPHVGLVTSCARGPGTRALLGLVVPTRDPVVTSASAGTVLVTRPGAAGAHFGVATDRLGAAHSCSGVLVAPVTFGSSLYGLIELGRSDHPFRATDREAAATITAAAARRLAIIRN